MTHGGMDDLVKLRTRVDLPPAPFHLTDPVPLARGLLVAEVDVSHFVHQLGRASRRLDEVLHCDSLSVSKVNIFLFV